ncbi:MAG TPA: DUF2993 domain-containing protein [Capsulimonadaceae bacterium]|nr:DUF2993 domain-containing protein [Capsulimonadaceae bacterium]
MTLSGHARIFRLGTLIGFLPLLILVWGCGNPIDHKVSDRIAGILPKTLGPAKSYDVKTTGTSLHLTSGHIGRVTIHGEDVLLAPGLTVDTFDADVQDIALDTRSQRVTGMSPIQFTVGISAAHLNSYLASTAASSPSRPQNLAVTLSGQTLAINFTVRPLLVNVPVSVVGALAPQAGKSTELNFVPTGAHVSIVPVPSGLVNLALSHVNPVVDLGSMRFPLAIDRCWVQSGNLCLSGTATIPPSSFSHPS